MKQLTSLDKVREFTVAMGQPVDQPFSVKLMELRERLLDEEHREVKAEIATALVELERSGSVSARTRQALLKELADLKYVLDGFAVTFGLDLDVAFNRVHASNMSKLGPDGKPIYREDGKVLKGPNYQPPKLDDL